MSFTTRSPAVARMADHTAPVIKLTLSLILPGLREWDGIWRTPRRPNGP